VRDLLKTKPGNADLHVCKLNFKAGNELVITLSAGGLKIHSAAKSM